MVKKRQRKKNNKGYQFSVGEKTLQKYKKEVRNTKAKIRRIKKEHNIDVSKDVPIPDLEDFSSRKELNQWVRQVHSFRNRSNRNYQYEKNEYGVSASKKRLDEIRRKNKQDQRQAKEEIEKYEDRPFISGGKEQGTVGLQRPSKHGIYIPNDFDFDDVRSPQRLDEIEEGIDKRIQTGFYDERTAQAKRNFMEMLKGSFNSLADTLLEEINSLTPNEFWELYLSVDEFDFDYFDTEGQDVILDESSIGKMLGEIVNYKRGNSDTDLWHENFRK